MLKILQARIQQCWTLNFQMFKLDLKKTEEPEIKLPTSAGSSRKQESSRKTSISSLLTIPKPLTVWITTNWKILKEMGIPDHLTCFLRNLYAGQEATVRTGHGTTDWFQIGKGVHQGCMLSPCLFNLYAEYIMRNDGVDEAQAGIKISRRNINNLRYTNKTTLMAESEELKSLLMKVQFSSVAQSCPTLCNPMNHSTPDLPVYHQLLESTQTPVHWVGDNHPAISSSVIYFSSCPQSFLASGSFLFFSFLFNC